MPRRPSTLAVQYEHRGRSKHLPVSELWVQANKGGGVTEDTDQEHGAAKRGVVHRAVKALGQSGAIHLLIVVRSGLADRLSL